MDKNFRQKCFDEVFMSHKWGDSSNAGKNYKRKYSKTHGGDYPAAFKIKR